MDYQTLTKHNNERLEAALKERIEALPMHERLKEAMLYAMDGGGKRLRPILLLETHALFSEDTDAAMPFAVSLEMIHNYSLVHDDLPAMDDDDYRRGRPSVHRAFDEGLAILAGDALLNGAMEIALSAACEQKGGIRAAQALIAAAGTDGMLSGQVMDLYDDVKDRQHLLRLYEKKTGRLILAACEAGAMLGNASEAELVALTSYAAHLGAAFQIQDDLLDAEQDLAQRNMTILRFLSSEEARDQMLFHTEQALDDLDKLARDTGRLRAITESLVNRNL